MKKSFPNIVRVIHQENGGHGEAVNTGIKNATGLYFKVVDSDDCLGRKALEKVLNLLEEMVAKKMQVLICLCLILCMTSRVQGTRRL